MRPIEKSEEYRGRVITATPHHSRCSNYALTIAPCGGAPARHVPEAGTTPDRALSLGREMVDFDENLG